MGEELHAAGSSPTVFYSVWFRSKPFKIKNGLLLQPEPLLNLNLIL